MLQILPENTYKKIDLHYFMFIFINNYFIDLYDWNSSKIELKI